MMTGPLPFVIGIAGGTGSGKTTLVRALTAELGRDRVTLLEQDAYYRDPGPLSAEERAARNYDHPDAIDTPLLIQHVQELRAGRAVASPRYDFVRHERLQETARLEPRPFLLVEGILVLVPPALRELMDLRLFVETDADIRFLRRLRRDLTERGRTLESVVAQWEATVRPMHLQFVEPSKRHADLIIPEGGENLRALAVLARYLREDG